MVKGKNEHLIVRKPINVNELPDHKLSDVIPFPILMCKDLVPEAQAWALYLFITCILGNNYMHMSVRTI
ncbi:MAG: hypothetical protein JRD69_09515 [Deltaproteobacteria bacterium]|nr:hypothetical protein [Deltaproteobacteria bacterium]